MCVCVLCMFYVCGGKREKKRRIHGSRRMRNLCEKESGCVQRAAVECISAVPVLAPFLFSEKSLGLAALRASPLPCTER